MTKNFRSFSFEFFPPKTPQGKKKIKAVAKKLEFFSPEYFSVTFGAGGSTKQGTIETCISIASNSTEACPHLSGVGSSKEMIKQILNKYPDGYCMDSIQTDQIIEGIRFFLKTKS